MIHIRIMGEPGQIRGLLVWGHAGYQKAGRDIVCAGVSAVATTCLLGLDQYLPRCCHYGISPEGLLFCRLKANLPTTSARDAQMILGTAVRGLEEIYQSHQGYIDFAYRR